MIYVCLSLNSRLLHNEIYVGLKFNQWEKEDEQTRALAKSHAYVSTKTLSSVSTSFTCVFVVEVLLKVIAFTLRGYWQSRRNRYDLFVSVMGVAWIAVWNMFQAVQ